MSNDNKQPREQRYPVAKLVLREKQNLPIGGMTDILLGGGTQENKPRFVIEYIPAMRHHRVAYFAAGAKAPTEVKMFSEGAAAYWEPVPQ